MGRILLGKYFFLNLETLKNFSSWFVTLFHYHHLPERQKKIWYYPFSDHGNQTKAVSKIFIHYALPLRLVPLPLRIICLKYRTTFKGCRCHFLSPEKTRSQDVGRLWRHFRVVPTKLKRVQNTLIFQSRTFLVDVKGLSFFVFLTRYIRKVRYLNTKPSWKAKNERT